MYLSICLLSLSFIAFYTDNFLLCGFILFSICTFPLLIKYLPPYESVRFQTPGCMLITELYICIVTTSARLCILELMCVHDCSVTQLCPALCDPMDCSLRGSSDHGIFQARILEWVAISFSRGSSPSRDRTPSLLCLLHCRQILYLLSHQRRG